MRKTRAKAQMPKIIISTEGAIGKVVPDEGQRGPVPYVRLADMRKGKGRKAPRG